MMDSDNQFIEDEVVASLDFILSEIQKDIVRLIVLINTVLILQGTTFLFIAWIADSFLVTIVIGLIGAAVFLVSLLVGMYNMQQYSQASEHVEKMKEEHPEIDSPEDADSSK